MTERTFVYAIGRPEGPIKVGITSSLLSRLRSLQTGSAYRLDLIYVFTASSRDEAAKMEKWFHDVHADKRLEGEWFDLDADLAVESLADQVDLSSTFCTYYHALFAAEAK